MELLEGLGITNTILFTILIIVAVLLVGYYYRVEIKTKWNELTGSGKPENMSQLARNGN